ncbi:MAG TPA: hypothetical protein VKP65_18750 [Rhodothermales bacterium]|nr:hypothetical protein [Rhodothermales bacterium]
MPARLLFFCLVLLIGYTGDATAQYTLTPEDIYVGTPVTITLAEPADTLTVTYRPNSSIATQEFLLTNGQQTVEWIPQQAGVAAISTPSGGAQNVSVRFQSSPVSGIFVLFLAGFILFGGVIFAFIKLFKNSPEKLDPEIRPDT